ncbi:MAG: hypothetical protein IFK91_01720, partial [Acidobacteria bacterium]|nr:hypothetical protein [Candidatus Sulfomarinibacter sp. MAG AM1]
VSLTAFAETVGAAASNLEVDRVLGEEFLEVSLPLSRAKIHVLPSEPPQNPLDDLLADLEVDASTELLIARVGVAVQDPRWWRGSLEREWRRRGWRVRFFSVAEDVDIGDVDLLVVHHQQASSWAGREGQWLQVIGRATAADPPLPVVWVAPLSDAGWVHQLIEAGVSFLMPAPQAEASESMARFGADVSLVVERLLEARRSEEHSALPPGVTDLVSALLSESDPDQGVSSLLQVAAEHFERGAVLMAEETLVRCRAGFGYPLDRNSTTLPREVGLLEHVICTGEAVMAIDPESGEVGGLAEVLGVSELPAATAVIPLGRGGGVAGILVADRQGRELPDLDDLVLLAGRLGGAAVR